MLAKQAWRLLNNNNPLVTSCLKAMYYPKGDFLSAGLGSYPSYMWRSLVAAQEVMKRGGRRKIGDGTQTKIWEVPWLPQVENGYMTTEMPEYLTGSTVSSFMRMEEKQWDDAVIMTYVTREIRNLLSKSRYHVAKQLMVGCGYQKIRDALSLKAVTGYCKERRVHLMHHSGGKCGILNFQVRLYISCGECVLNAYQQLLG